MALLAGAVGLGSWQYTRQSDLFDGFEYLDWDSVYQRRIIEIDSDDGDTYKIMELARRYSDHWILVSAFPDGFTSLGADQTNRVRIFVYWDADCANQTEVDTGYTLTDGQPLTLKCKDGDKLLFKVSAGPTNPEGISTPWEVLDELDDIDYGGFKAELSLVKYWPWDDAKKFHTLQKARPVSSSD